MASAIIHSLYWRLRFKLLAQVCLSTPHLDPVEALWCCQGHLPHQTLPLLLPVLRLQHISGNGLEFRPLTIQEIAGFTGLRCLQRLARISSTPGGSQHVFKGAFRGWLSVYPPLKLDRHKLCGSRVSNWCNPYGNETTISWLISNTIVGIGIKMPQVIICG